MATIKKTIKTTPKPAVPSKGPKKGRPTNLKREKQGHIDTYDFKFEDELKRPLKLIQPNEVEKIILSKGFVRSYVNMDINSKNIGKDLTHDNAKRLGILWMRYTHPQIPKILNSDWNVGVCLKTTLMDNPKMSLSFVLFNEKLRHHLDLDGGFEVAVKASDRNKIGLETALINLFEKYRDLQKLIITFTKKNTISEESKKEVAQMFAKIRLVKPFIDTDDYKKSSVDFSDLDNALKSFPKTSRLIDLIAYYNHFILDGENRIKYVNSMGGHESAGPIKNVRRVIDLQKNMAAAVFQFIEKKTK
jgi:hypothetical protein